MPHSLDQILPSIQAFGVYGYWLIGLASALEAYFLSGVIVPGTLIVDAGGILVQRGLLDFMDLVWFVAIGSVLGSEAGYWTGRLAVDRLPGRQRFKQSKVFGRAESLFRKRGGLALVIGRFMGPVAGLVPLAAAMAGMDRRRFAIWNILGSIPYALVHVAIGYFLGDIAGRVGGSFTRFAVLAGVLAVLLIGLWSLLYSALRLLPLALAVLSAALRALGDFPAVKRLVERHPGAAAWIRARFDRDAFHGLPLTGLAVVFVYIGAVWLDSIFDFALGGPLLQVDQRLAELIHHFQSPIPIDIATRITAVGSWQVVTPLVAATIVWLLGERRYQLAVGMLVSVLGSTVSVAMLKLAFQRPRSPLGYYLETSNSFPSGHAATSIGFYSVLMYVVWRSGKLRAETALLGAGLMAFAIGVSRIYLIEHYLSDVLNGWLVGILWLLIAIAVSEWLTSRNVPPQPVSSLRRPFRLAGSAAMIVLIGAAATNVWRYDHPLNTPVQSSADRLLSDPRALANAADFPGTTESLLGSPVRSITLVVLARDQAALGHALGDAGWTASAPPGPGTILDALYAAIGGNEDPTIETVAHFWRGRPNDLAFVKPAGGKEPAKGQALHARFWRSEYVTANGLRVFAGSVGVDENGGTIPGGSEAGNADAQAGLIQDLLDRGLRIVARIELSRPVPGGKPAPGSFVNTAVLAMPD